MKTTIGAFLLQRLREIGVTHIPGVPGDYNLQFLEQIDDAQGIDFIGTCNELNAAYAADGYARIRGAGAVLTTYGVGELSALNGIAGAACEHVPVVAITGAPPLYAMEEGWLLHHTLAEGDYDDMMAAFTPFTVAQTRLTPANAAAEIDRVLIACMREKKPVYIQLPSNISYLEIEAPDTPIATRCKSDPASLTRAADHLARKWQAAHRPAILVDMDAARFGLADPLLRLAEKTATRFAAMTTGKSILPENHPLSLGLYNGKASTPETRAAIEESDCLLATAPRFIEVNSGLFSARLPDCAAMLRGHSLRIEGVVYEGVEAADLIEALIDRLPKADAVARVPVAPARVSAPDADAPLRHAALWPRLAGFLRPGDVVMAENGTSNIGLTPQALPDGVTLVNQNIWGSIGYTLPATLGTALAAPDRRHVLFIGDGSLQLTVQELSTMLRLGQKPVIFVINNRGYTIERYILGMRDAYNDIADWRYTDLPAVFGGQDFTTAQARTGADLEAALKQADASDCLSLIELHLDPFDAPEALKSFGPAVAEFDYGPSGPQGADKHRPPVNA